jgi:hypothetical protein
VGSVSLQGAFGVSKGAFSLSSSAGAFSLFNLIVISSSSSLALWVFLN